ncbi:hypothetical protein U9M48_001922 [Paspalum notatum var. saurae]|uniref:Uncharacterized protein n=1 Tax=Paspalum notatum var. saurae TaxID=547442 RepID=A0AAQ3PIS1_PASNO
MGRGGRRRGRRPAPTLDEAGGVAVPAQKLAFQFITNSDLCPSLWERFFVGHEARPCGPPKSNLRQALIKAHPWRSQTLNCHGRCQWIKAVPSTSTCPATIALLLERSEAEPLFLSHAYHLHH